MVEAEHAHVAGEPLHLHVRPRLGHHDVEQVVRLVERALGVDGHVGAELVGNLVERTLEVRGELARVAPRGPAADTVTLEQQHSLRRRAEGEECRRDAGDARTDDGDVRPGIGGQSSRRAVGCHLGYPGGAQGLVGVRVAFGLLAARRRPILHASQT